MAGDADQTVSIGRPQSTVPNYRILLCSVPEPVFLVFLAGHSPIKRNTEKCIREEQQHVFGKTDRHGQIIHWMGYGDGK